VNNQLYCSSQFNIRVPVYSNRLCEVHKTRKIRFSAILQYTFLLNAGMRFEVLMIVSTFGMWNRVVW
jgi:hypothetical protein